MESPDPIDQPAATAGQVGNGARTLNRAVADMNFAVHYAELHEKLWSHLDTLLKLVQITAASLASVAAVAQLPAVTIPLSIVVAVATGVQMSVDPASRKSAFRDARREAQQLLVGIWDRDVKAIDDRFAAASATWPRGLASVGDVVIRRMRVQAGDPPGDLSGTARLIDLVV